MHLFINKSNSINPTRFISFVIIFSVIIIYIQESGCNHWIVNLFDVICTAIFVVEMFAKIVHYGLKNYFKIGWNTMDFILVIVSMPSLVTYGVDINMYDLSCLLVLRVLRVFRISRILKIFPNRDIRQLGRNIIIAFKDSFVVFVGFFMLIITFSLISCALFKDIAPDYFATPTDGIYTTFRLFTIEGWYDIPDQISASISPAFGRFVRIYFSIVVIIGGVIGLSLVNSIFTDAMVSDNNDKLEHKVDESNKRLEQLLGEIKSLREEVEQLKKLNHSSK